MGNIRETASPVLLLVAAFASAEEPLFWAKQKIIQNFGPVALESPIFRFDTFTEYYAPSMGDVLYKRFWAMERLIDPADLATVKCLTNQWETESPATCGVVRPLNLDPGYIELGKLVLASTKDFAHRIYLRQGIFAEITLMYTKKRWTALPWTYSDYQSAEYHTFFTECREYLAAHPQRKTQSTASRQRKLAGSTLRNSFSPSAEFMTALAEFAAGAGHEINNPLAVISGHSQLLLREITHPEHRRLLGTIAAQAKRAYEMVADVRLFARPPKPKFESVDVDDILQKVVLEIMSADETPDGTEMNTSFPKTKDGPMVDKESFVIVSDPVQLGVIFSALIKNSIEADSRRIDITMIRGTEQPVTDESSGSVDRGVDRNFVEIRFTDDGHGISEEQRPLIFLPYYSGRQANRGLGFGLPKVWQLLRQLGGTIAVSNTADNNGTSFVVHLPINNQ